MFHDKTTTLSRTLAGRPGLQGSAASQPGRAACRLTGVRSRVAVVVLLGGTLVLTAGCSGSRLVHAGTAPGGVRASGVLGSGGSCSRPASLPAGAVVAPWRLGSVLFTSARSGVAVTASIISCQIGPGGFVGQDQPVRLAVTSDGGHRWIALGSSLPIPAQWESDYQVVAVSGADVWVFSASAGRLLQTGNHGVTWVAQGLPGPALAVAGSGGWLWALSCPGVSRSGCLPEVSRMRLPGGAWIRTRPVTSVPVVASSLGVVSGAAAVVGLRGPKASLLASTTDGGASWSVRPAPADPGFTCDSQPGTFATAGPVWWQLCSGGTPGMQGSNTALLRSDNDGRSWTVVAATIVGHPGQLPTQAYGFAAGSARLLWIATSNVLSVSADGGRLWSMVPVVNTAGIAGQFDVLPGVATWLLAPDAGLWQTVNGTSWHAVGAPAPS
jgi:hypothetical protein